MTDPGRFIDLVFTAEPIVKKILPLSTLYAFRTTGGLIKAHAMFIFSPLDEDSSPTSTAHYLLQDGSLLNIVSFSAITTRRLLEDNSRLSRAESRLLLTLDFYYPPCVYTLREIMPLRSLLREKFGESFTENIPELFKPLLDRCTVYVDEDESSLAYVLEHSIMIDVTLLSSSVVFLALVKLLLEEKINDDKALSLLRRAERVITENFETQ